MESKQADISDTLPIKLLLVRNFLLTDRNKEMNVIVSAIIYVIFSRTLNWNYSIFHTEENALLIFADLGVFTICYLLTILVLNVFVTKKKEM